MAVAISLLTASACTQARIAVKPDPLMFGRTYGRDMVVAGEKLVAEHCAGCHRIDREGAAAAPPLNTLLIARSSDQLADDLMAGLPMDHGGMPVFEFNVVGALSVVAYLETLRQAPATCRIHPDRGQILNRLDVVFSLK